jgi:hypothetical protein
MNEMNVFCRIFSYPGETLFFIAHEKKTIPTGFKLNDHGGILCARAVESIFIWNFSG